MIDRSNKIIVAFNGLPLIFPPCGIRVYTENLLKQFSYNPNIIILLFVPEKINLSFSSENIIIKEIKFRNYFSGNYNYLNKAFWEIFSLPKIVKKSKAQIYFSPYQAMTIFSLKIPSVVVIHDTLQWNRKIEDRDIGKQFIYHIYKLGCKKATKIITISQNSQKDIIKELGKTKKDVVIAYEGINHIFDKVMPMEKAQKIIQKFDICRPYIFNAGGFHKRKNIRRILLAFKKFCENNKKEWHLVIIGEPMHPGKGIYQFDEINKTIIQSKVLEKKVKFIKEINDDELVALYRLADFSIYPSLYEGFGLPPLESMSQGVAVITSNNSSLPEISGEGAMLINPYSIDELHRAMSTLSLNEDIKKQLVRKGYEQLKKFSWKKTTKIIEELFYNLIV